MEFATVDHSGNACVRGDTRATRAWPGRRVQRRSLQIGAAKTPLCIADRLALRMRVGIAALDDAARAFADDRAVQDHDGAVWLVAPRFGVALHREGGIDPPAFGFRGCGHRWRRRDSSLHTGDERQSAGEPNKQDSAVSVLRVAGHALPTRRARGTEEVPLRWCASRRAMHPRFFTSWAAGGYSAPAGPNGLLGTPSS